MRSFLSKQDINKNVLLKFSQYVADEQYDTDSLKADIETIGNVDEDCRSKTLIESIEEFIKSTAVKSTSFNIGITLYYWPKYKGLAAFDQNTNQWNINDHGGYNFSTLYVQQKYSSFKEEISNYFHFNMLLYKDLVIKINEYL
eukprot:127011_1